METGPYVYDETLARHYDEDYDILRHQARDVAFYRELALASPAPALDLGCGTGRVLLSLARAGVAVTGVDPSPAMLDRLAARLADEPESVRRRVTLVQGSSDALGVDGPFGLVFAAFRVFQHLETPADQEAALAEIARVLAPDGQLAFDVFDFDPALAARHVDEHVDYVLDDRGTRRERRSTALIDREAGVLAGEFRWLVDGTCVDRAPFRLSVLGKPRIEELLHGAGLQLAGLWRDFEGTPWRAGDPLELVVLARRAPGGAGR